MKLHGAGESNQGGYIVSELLTKGDMYDLVVQGGGITERTLRFVMKQIFEAVGYVHE